MRRFLVAIFAVAALMTMATATLAVPPEGLHCPDGWVTKDESGADDNELVLAEGTMFCVKAGSTESNESEQGNTGILTADGETTLCEYLEAANIVGGDGRCRDVSYWAEYGTAPTPTPTPTPTATPTSTPVSTPTSTPAQRVPNTAMGTDGVPIAASAFAIMLIASVLALAVFAKRERRSRM